jgi:hypothetical protein
VTRDELKALVDKVPDSGLKETEETLLQIIEYYTEREEYLACQSISTNEKANGKPSPIARKPV